MADVEQFEDTIANVRERQDGGQGERHQSQDPCNHERIVDFRVGRETIQRCISHCFHNISKNSRGCSAPKSMYPEEDKDRPRGGAMQDV